MRYRDRPPGGATAHLLAELARVDGTLRVFELRAEHVDERPGDEEAMSVAVDLQHVLAEADVRLGELDRVRCQRREDAVCNVCIDHRPAHTRKKVRTKVQHLP